ncbi:EAL domain-containing protein [Thiohalobacter sp. IOR34]|uniref:EAL domain-containing protein n=1 Tax=Thiohalobacter sp. IOR34 TaxID=3057176 RepID=UPI0025B0799D|nr:EAL domain-containing protein [Thiohalobacter sp. IOR34]WJW76626.1 EAL domain-containing protein [Thiohalobacter sp. IOR34]
MFRPLSRPLPLSAYTGIFVVLTLTLFCVLGWLTLQQLDEARREIEAVEKAAAQQEFRRLLRQSEQRLRHDARQLGAWDELRQQLREPLYYAYWRGHRLLKPGNLPPHIVAAEVYDSKRQALAQVADSQLPHRLQASPDAYLLRDGEGVYLYLFEPVSGDDGRHLLGHLGLKADLPKLLLDNSHFRYLDEDSLRFKLPAGQRIALSRLAEYTHIGVRNNPENGSLQQIMEMSVIRLSLIIGILVLAFYAMLATLLGLPLRRLSRIIDQMKANPVAATALSHNSLPIAELEKVRSSLDEYQQQLQEVHQNLDEKNRALWDMAHHDALTGTYNRRAFDHDWTEIRSTLNGQRLEIAFILFDCDHFKAINDSYGHQTGDQVIQRLARSILNGLRQGDRLYRIGGDEFATILLNCNRDCAQEVARRCIKHIGEEDFSGLGIMEPVRISVGIALADGDDGTSLSELQGRADIAMYRAKRPNADPVQVYCEAMREGTDTLFSNRLINAVYSAIRDGSGIEMHYQPIVRLEDLSVDYYEALVRIRQNGELFNPGSFLPLVEARRLALEFDIAVLAAIRTDLHNGRLPAGTGVSINLSGNSICHPSTLKALAPLALLANEYRLVLEITETTLITQLKAATQALDEARKLGFEIALDDFGSGYSSLRYLAHMPVDIVKFDISMIRQLSKGGRQQTMIGQLAEMIADAGYRLVAEGIEDATTLDIARRVRFSHGQGYLFGRPAPLVDSPVNAHSPLP